ncbi:MAG: twin-arginine translocase TatA/TatE family subunit [Bacteroidales bacterium]|nr:twin-arginine translocase TatA/TatE family subunit [Bacteroidales bacterium]
MSWNFILSMIGPTEVIVVLIVVLLLFGGKKIPELMRGLGKGMKEFKDASRGITEDDENDSKKKTERE